MTSFNSSSQLAETLDEATAVQEDAPPVDVMGKKVNSILEKWPDDRGIFSQLRRLSDFINETKSELQSLRPAEVKDHFIPTATDELDAIVEATASATHRIMDSADTLMELVGELPADDATRGMDAVTEIYEACTFQDITGQRVTKVVNMLKVIDERISEMCRLAGELGDAEEASSDSASAPPADAPSEESGESMSSQGDIDALFDGPNDWTDEDLLNGPALPGSSNSQDDIDALFDR